jgi:tripartite-type tricarboxylate transporter receptor subunit TctC
MHKKWRTFVVAGFAFMLLVAAACSEEEPTGGDTEAAGGEAEAEAPGRAVEFVVTTSPGGGSDVYARRMTSIIEQLDLSEVPWVVVNKDGGSGAVGMQYLHSKVGENNAVLITLNSVFTTPQLQELPFASISEDFTPIASMALDTFALWVHADTWETYEEFAAEAKERSLTAAGTGAKQEDEVLMNLFVRAGGFKPMKYLPQEGGGDVAAQLAGGHVDLTFNNPSEALPHVPDRLRPLVVFTPERWEEFPDVPTFEEVGLDAPELDYRQVRGIVGAPGMPEENLLWFEDIFRQVFESDEWQSALEEELLIGNFLVGDEFGEFLTEYDELHTDLMIDIGWVEE